MNEEEKKEKSFWSFSQRRKKFRSLWWVQLVFLFAFLVAAGLYSWLNLGGVAHKLVGGEGYDEYSADSALYSSGERSLLKKFSAFFGGEEKPPFAENAAVSALNRDLAGGLGGEKDDFAARGNGMPEDGEKTRDDFAKAGTAGPPAGMKKEFHGKLRPLNKGAFAPSGASRSKTAGEFSGGNENLVEVRKSEGEKQTGERLKGREMSAMKQLKSALKTGVYGARDASQDAAKLWVAKTFDNAGASRFSLEYDEKAKAQLDRVNPDSIPDFLREQNINDANKLSVKKVGDPEVDKEGTKDALENDKKYQAAKMAKDLSEGILNPMFSGMNFGARSETAENLGEDAEEPDVGSFSDPREKPDLGDSELNESGDGYFVDENGNMIDPDNPPWGSCGHYCTDTYCEKAETCWV